MVWFLMNLGCIARATPTEKKWETRTSNLRQNQKHTSSLLPFSHAISINTVSHPLTVSFSFSLSLSLSQSPFSLHHVHTPSKRSHKVVIFFHPILELKLKKFSIWRETKKIRFCEYEVVPSLISFFFFFYLN